MSLEALTRSPAWIVAGWTMLHFLWVGTIIGGAAVAGRWVLRSAEPNVRYAFALVCLGALALAPVLIAARVIHHRVGSPVSLPAGTIVMLSADSPPDGYSSREPLAGGVEAQPPGPFPESVAVPVNANRQPLALWIASAAGYLPWLWIVGSPMVFLTVATGLMGAERLRRQSRMLDTPDWRNTCRRLAERLKVRRAVAIATCERLVSPILVGIVRPMILLPPAALIGWTPEQIEMVLLHELAHVRRWDNLVNLLQRIVESLLFFHPVVWLVSGWVRREREHCCDELVLQATGKRRAYAETLAALAMPTPLVHRAAVAMGEHNVVARIRRILKLEESTMRPSGKLVVFAAIVLLAPALMLAVRAGQEDAAEPPTEPGRILRFPADRSFGEVHTRPRNVKGYLARRRTGRWEKLTEARGDVRVPTDVDVYLEVSRTTAPDLSPLLRLDSHDIDFLRIRRSEIDEAGLQQIVHLRGLKELDLEGCALPLGRLGLLRALSELQRIDLDGFRVEEPRQLTDAIADVLVDLPALESIVLRRTGITDACLAQLADMDSLRSLSVGATRVTDAGVTHLKRIPELSGLELGGFKPNSDITDASLEVIGELTRLTWLDLGGTGVTDAGLTHLRNLSHIEYLNLSNTSVTEAGFVHLQPLSSLKRFRFRGSVTDVGAGHLAKLPSLERLVNFDLNISDDGLAALMSLPRLKDLPLRQARITDAGLARLPTMRRLESLHLSGDDITDAGMQHVAKMTGLKTLSLEHVAVTDKGLASLAPLTSLERLTLEANKVTGVGLRHIAGHTALKFLSLRLEREPMTLNSLGTLTGLETLFIDAHSLRLPDDEFANLTPLKNLQTLRLDRCRIGDRGVAHLGHLTGLRELVLWETRVTDQGLSFLRGLRDLRSLEFVGAITDRGLDRIPTLPALETLRIGSYLPLSEQAIASLRKRMPSLKRFENRTPRETINAKDGILRRGRRPERGPLDALEDRAPPPLKVRDWVKPGDDPPRLDQLKGNVVLLGFWGPRNTWARHIVPRLMEVRDRHKNDGLVILGIHVPNAAERVVGMVSEFDGVRDTIGGVILTSSVLGRGSAQYARGAGSSFTSRNARSRLPTSRSLLETAAWPARKKPPIVSRTQFDVPWPMAVDINTQTFRAYGVKRHPSFHLIDRRGKLRVADLYWEDLDRAVDMLIREPGPAL